MSALKKLQEHDLNIISFVNEYKTVPFRKVANFLGQVISMSTVIGSVCQLMTRCISIMTECLLLECMYSIVG